MSRIEDALSKLQSERSSGAAIRRQIGRVVTNEPADLSAPIDHPYSGKQIQMDMLELVRNGLLAPEAQQQQLIDEYRTVKRPLLNNAHPSRQPPLPLGNLIMVGSAAAGEGKTFTCINLCLSIARERDWSVLLVDGDVRKPHLTRFFGAEGEPGLMDLLRDEQASLNSLVMPTDIPRLALLPAGRRDAHAVELFASARMTALSSELATSDKQRMVIFDSAPLLLTTEAPVLASQVGQVVLVVHANRTPQKAVFQAKERLDTSKAINLLLNQSDSFGRARSYGDYYSYGDP